MFASVAAALLAAAPVVGVHPAAYSDNPAVATEESRSPGEIAFDEYLEHFYRGRFAEALKAANSIELDASNRKGRGLVTGMRAAALLGLKRKGEADRLYAEAETLNPDEPMITNLRMMAALITEDGSVAINAFDHLIARFPDAARDVDPEVLWFLFQKENGSDKVAVENRRIALARLGYGGETYGDFITTSAIQALVKRGDLDGATELLKYLDEPSDIEDLLIQKRYAAIWLAVEAHAGPGLSNIRASSAEGAKRVYEADPTSWRDFAQYVDALRHARRYDEAIALKAKLPSTPEQMASVDEQIGWAFNSMAMVLHSAGRGDEADELFARLNTAKIENSGWRVSMVINRLELLVADQKYDRALTLMSEAEETARRDGNPYAQQLVRRLRYCTLAKLGRTAEAAKLKPEMLKHQKDAPGATIEGLLCAGDFDEAEKMALDQIKDGDGETSFIRNLQVSPLTGDDPSIWTSGWKVLRQRPAIAKEFDRLGRDLPDHLLAKSAA